MGSPLADQITPFLAMEVMERGMVLAASGAEIVPLGIGEPGFDAPVEAVERAISALRSGATHYTDSMGLRELREAIAVDCERRRGVAVDPDRVLVTAGSSPGIQLALLATVQPGDEVVIATPHYPCYPNMVRVCGGVSVFVPTRPEDGYRIDPEQVRAALSPRTRMILLASPANPTGAVQPPEVVEALCALGVPLLSDEIYDGLLYDGARVSSPLRFGDQHFVSDGFSKRYAMTGFRLGYLIVPPTAVRALRSLHQNLFISTSQFVQEAGIAALEHGEDHLKRMLAIYARRRDRLISGLRSMGFGIPVDPDGAFYALVDARHLDGDSLRLAFRILERTGVACGPGRDFGAVAEGFLRFSFASSDRAIEQGLSRLEAAVADGSLRSPP